MNTRKRRSGHIAIASFLLALILGSCSRVGEIKLPANPILSGGLGWAVVKDAYIRLKESPSDSARDLDHLRRGGVFRLDERELSSSLQTTKASLQPEVWYELDSDGVKGWVREESLDIYASESQADTAAANYR
jgi:hypothetical protein